MQDVEDGLSEFPHGILSQARIQDLLLDVMRKSPSRLTPDYAMEMTSLEVAESGDHPGPVTLRRIEGEDAGQETTSRSPTSRTSGSRR